MHVAHIVTAAIMLAVIGMSCAGLGLSWAHATASKPSSPAVPYTDYTVDLHPFERCNTATINPILPNTTVKALGLNTGKCPNWNDYWSNNVKYCPTIGGTGSVNTTTMLDYMRTAQAGGILFVIGSIVHLLVFVVFALGFVAWPALLPTIFVASLGWALCVGMWGRMFLVCDQTYCDAVKSQLQKSLAAQSVDCYIADGFRVTVAAYILFLLLLIPTFVFKKAAEEPVKKDVQNEPLEELPAKQAA